MALLYVGKKIKKEILINEANREPKVQNQSGPQRPPLHQNTLNVAREPWTHPKTAKVHRKPTPQVSKFGSGFAICGSSIKLP